MTSKKQPTATITNPPPANDRRIVKFIERNVWLGYYHPAVDGKPAYLTDAKCIRYWGTTKGLGEIALNGCTPKTILDDGGVLVIDNPAAVLFTLKCEW